MWFIHGPKHCKENQSLNLKHSCWLPCVKHVDMICGRSMVTTPIRFSKRKSMGGNILGTWATAETVAHTLEILELNKYWQQSHICIKNTYWNEIPEKVGPCVWSGENYFELTYTCISKKKIVYETLRSNHISALVTTLRAIPYAVPFKLHSSQLLQSALNYRERVQRGEYWWEMLLSLCWPLLCCGRNVPRCWGNVKTADEL